MYCRDLKELDAPSRRLRTFRRVVNVVPFFFATTAAFALFLWAFPGSRDALVALALPINVLFAVVVLPWFVLSTCFMWGLVKCPYCGERFCSGFTIFVDEECQHCGFNVVSMTRKGDF